MKWITHSQVHVDRTACAWLITRFIDSDAELLFVLKSRLLEMARAEGAIPYDGPGVELGHHDGKCSFEAFVSRYALTDPGILRMAKIIHTADTDDPVKDPIAAGLCAIAVGYNLIYPSDLDNLEHQFEVYDALYAWCRLGK